MTRYNTSKLRNRVALALVSGIAVAESVTAAGS